MTVRTALVTGGSRGIGAAIVRRFQADGFEVLAPLRAELDLNSARSLDMYVQGTRSQIDILVNCAGVNYVETCGSITASRLDETLRVNLVSPILLARALLPGMMDRGYGRVVNISSIFSLVSRGGRTTYSSSKAGLNAMTRALAIEGGARGVLVNAVAPGYVSTELTSQNNTPSELEAIAETIPVRRLATSQEIAEVVFFLCSERNTYITGQVVVVDGGYTCV